MTKLNGWLRLWVLSCLVYAAWLGWGAYENYTTEERFDVRWEIIKNQNIRSIAARASEITRGFEPGPLLDELNMTTRLAMENEAERIDALKSDAYKDLAVEQAQQARTWLLWWFEWAIGSYAAGWLIHWVFRGFRPKVKSAS